MRNFITVFSIIIISFYSCSNQEIKKDYFKTIDVAQDSVLIQKNVLQFLKEKKNNNTGESIINNIAVDGYEVICNKKNNCEVVLSFKNFDKELFFKEFSNINSFLRNEYGPPIMVRNDPKNIIIKEGDNYYNSSWSLPNKIIEVRYSKIEENNFSINIYIKSIDLFKNQLDEILD